MSEQGEKTCPLCTEEMDLTDQQLKPCKCGYEICVWCWHHIMDMAEKDDTEGRCPACRTPYDKEKIVGMAEKCERLVAEVNSERKLKSQKSRPKTSEGRKHLSSVRVIQRNLVYIIGIPANLADEDLLQHKEYFGQYGKVLKVSISRTAGGAIQYSPTNTCSVYVTYSKEEEAVRCIHSVHGYFLDGKPLRACFGTTKYCHTWLRNMSCSNPDCLYLHEIGTQEDSFTKDEIISAYTRSRVQQITGATNNSQRRSGNTLPPPADEFCSSSPASSGKPITQTAPNIPASQVKGSPPNGTSGRSIALPAAAAWGLRVSNGRPPTPSSACSNGLAKQKPDAYNGLYPSLVASTPRGSTLNTDVGKKTTTVYEDSQVQHPNSSLGSLESSKQYIVRDSGTTIFDSRPSEVVQNTPLNSTDSVELDRLSSSSASDKDGSLATNGPIQSICSGVSSIGIDSHLEVNHSDVIEHNNSDSNFRSFGLSGNQGMQQYYPEHVREPLISLPSRKGAKESDGVSVSEETSDWRSKSPAHVLVDAGGRVEEDSIALDMRRLKISEGFVGHSSEHGGHADSGTMHAKVDETLHQYNDSLLSNGLNERKDSSSSELKKVFESASLFSNAEKAKFLGEFNNGATTADQGPEADIGESSIISSILSLGFDEWDDSLTSPNNLAKLLNETDGSVKISSSWKVQNNNQSRFSFARQEDSVNQGSDLEPPFSDILHRPTRYSVPQKSLLNRDAYFDDLCDGFSAGLLEESDNFSSSRSIISSNLLSASRPQVSAPPGFSVPSRAPPPGFSFQERMDQTFGSVYGNHFLESSSSPRNQYPTQPTGNFGSIADVEFIDPAILAVGKGRLPNGISNNGFDTRSAFTPQLSASSENDPRLQLLLQQSLSSHQNMRFPDHHIGDRFSPISDPYNNIPSRLLEQSQASNLSSPFAQLSLPQPRNAHMLNNGHWEGWNGIHQTRNDLGMAELIRNEGLGFNKHFPGYEDLKFRMPSSGDMYNNRAFGI